VGWQAHVLYAKHMAKHKVGLNQSLTTRATHMVGGCRSEQGRHRACLLSREWSLGVAAVSASQAAVHTHHCSAAR
jgi:hypothetical protein